jgi:methylenetetrahydrofolate reductase (NADPH)
MEWPGINAIIAEEYVYMVIDGSLERKVVRKRPGTVGICAALQNGMQMAPM